MKKFFEEVLCFAGEVYVMIVARNHCTPTTLELFKQYELLSDKLKFYCNNGYTEKDLDDLKHILSELERIEDAYWEDCRKGEVSWRLA